jgi:NAD(P)-dependent dehydrogenase (short-subunit alcohol dehydrogenase family)
MSDIFEGKNAVVTGGTSGIGYAVSEELLKRGANVHVIGSRTASVEKTKASFARYPRASFAAVDVTKADAVRTMIQEYANESGRLDYLFNNAGMGATYPADLLTLDDWKKGVDLNLWGVIHGVYAALPIMLKQGSGHIVNTSSVAGIIAPPYQSLYCATKYAVTGMTEAMRYEFADRGIVFTTICPANVATAIFAGVDIPPDAIPADEAAKIILAGVANKEALVIFPESVKKLYENCNARPDLKEKYWMAYARLRREGFEKGEPVLGLPPELDRIFDE